MHRMHTRPRMLRDMALACLVLLTACVADYYAYPTWARVGGQSLNKGENGLWLRYTWYFGRHDEQQTRRMADDLSRRQIRYAYFHVRYIQADGTLRYRHPDHAQSLVRILHERAPGVKAIAWVYAGNRRGQGNVELADPRVRRRMVAAAQWLVNDCGFDGVQWDYEVCPDGDESFISLLEQTRAALPAGKLLGAAVPMRMPWPMRRWGWSEPYFARVAQSCDQMAVMCYDSGQMLPRAYVRLVRQQAIRITRAVDQAGSPCRVLLGLPTYEKGPVSHNPRAENIRLALKGVREGLQAKHAQPAVFAGVAIFADYTTDATEWHTYDRAWLQGGSGARQLDGLAARRSSAHHKQWRASGSDVVQRR